MPLPSIGQEIPVACHASDTPLRVDALGLVTVDIKGGFRARVEQEVQAGVKLKVVGFEMSGDSPVLGRVTLAWADLGTSPLSAVEVNGSSNYRNTMYFDWTLTIEKPPSGGGPMTLSGTKTAVLIGDQLTNYPPQGVGYQLQQPVDFAPAGNPGQVVASLQQLSATVSYVP
ncbi:hypothetical protein OG819_47245 [Streptomyces sp. NBC_01549]|nr:hypothetical protein [Streptomyces sp. NBC_01549]